MNLSIRTKSRSGPRWLGLLVTIVSMLSSSLVLRAADIEWNLASRDRSTGERSVTPTKIDPRKIGVVVVDMWNWHWCKTAAARVGSLVPRMNPCLRSLRKLGAQVFLCPTDSVDAYVGTPQREAALAVETLALPAPHRISCPPPPNGPGCACVDRCRGNWGWNRMHPDLEVGERDLMPNSREALYTLAKQRGITHLIYLGVHTQVCLLGKDIGLLNMKALGFECVLARDLTDSHPDYDPEKGIDPDDLTARTVAHFERYLCSTVSLWDELVRLGYVERQRVDPVRAAPWGTKRRPHIFETQTIVTLSAPRQAGATIRFTRDGSAPKSTSERYERPFRLTETTVLRAQAFDASGKAVCLQSRFHFDRLGKAPAVPDVHLADVKPLRVLGPGHSPSDRQHRFAPVSKPPQRDVSNRGQPLRVGGREWKRGLGVHAPNRVEFAVDPKWIRFVASAGVDENILATSFGSDLGCIPSVVFSVFIDGKRVAYSPIMRFLHPAWRFDVEIPAGAKRIVLVVQPTEDGNREDLANWAGAGFILKKKRG